MEVELKYRVTDPATGERLLLADQLGGLQATGGRARATQLEDRYVDTGDGALAKAGFAVRLRQSGADTIVSVKSLTAGAGRWWRGRARRARGASRSGGARPRSGRPRTPGRSSSSTPATPHWSSA